MNEPEEEVCDVKPFNTEWPTEGSFDDVFSVILQSKPPPPPPTGFPAMAQMPGPAGPGAPSSSGPPVNMFSRKAGRVKVILQFVCEVM